MIRVKVKTLLLTVIGLLLLVFAITPFINIELANYLSNRHPIIAEKLYKNYIKYPTGTRKDEALYKKSQASMNDYGKYNIFLGGKLWNKLIDYTTIQGVIENYEKIIKDYPESKYFSKAYKAILDTYIYIGNHEEVDKWIGWGKDQDHREIREISILYDAYVHFANRKYKEAEEILEDFTLGNENMDYIYYFLKGHIAFAMEDFDRALGFYEKASDIGWQYESNFFAYLTPDGRRHWLSTLDFHKGDNKIRGRVSLDGVGIPFVEVFVQYSHSGYSSSSNDFIAITDKDGYFETIGIKDGQYDIGIGIGTPLLFDKVYLDKNLQSIRVDGDMEFNFEFISPMKVLSPRPGEVVGDNKFIVEWEEVEGADYYTVYSIGFEDPVNMKGSSLTFGLIDEKREYKIKDNRAVFDLSIINEERLGSSFKTKEEIINPQAILGYFYKGAEMPIIVSAYDKDGNKLNSSIPLATYYDNVPSIKIEGMDLTVGEELILNREYEKAIAHYENLLNEEGDNIEALRYLSRIHMVDWKKGKKDIVKSIDYGIKLYELTGETKSLTSILFEMDPSEQRQYKDLVERIVSAVSEEDMDEDLLNPIGAYYKYIGEFEKAREIMTREEDYTLIPDITYMDIYLEDYEIALERLKDKKAKFHYMDKEKLMEGIEVLKGIDKNSEDYKKFKDYLYRLISRDLDYSESYNDFQNIYGSIKNQGIRNILNEIGKDNRWVLK